LPASDIAPTNPKDTPRPLSSTLIRFASAKPFRPTAAIRTRVILLPAAIWLANHPPSGVAGSHPDCRRLFARRVDLGIGAAARRRDTPGPTDGPHLPAPFSSAEEL